MAATFKAASRYSSYDSRSSTSSSTELKQKPGKSPALAPASSSSSSSRALVRTKASDLPSGAKNRNFADMVKKFMGKKSSSGAASRGKLGSANLVIPVDVIAEDLKKGAKSRNQLGVLPKKLFGGGLEKKVKKESVKALTEVKGGGINARTLAMVLRGERELLSANKELEMEVAELKLMLEQKNREVEKLKDLCLSQRDEIKALKSAVLFPEVTNNELQEQLEKQGTELRQAKMIIPALQKQVTSLTGQLQCLADDLAEVKADTYSAKACFQHQIGSSPRTPIYNHEEAANSLQFSSSEATAPGSPDDLFLKDLNPCLTPNNGKTGSLEFKEELEYSSSRCVGFSDGNIGTFYEAGFNPCPRKLSKSSDCCQKPCTTNRMARAGRR
ncbi:uncharacterized protein LOC115742926 isoform X1 [Rhodamnia argentea]|uniref:Uncharacterized protein LOC115742926 isoform X1 n=1 Tax=Rhodamnia argentea TaxID=178133 RepID=A0A8B8PEU6_9MYRT|nr:uncharacterized protein LOC115742926 isoform X1 [Rhodamnia argentea]